MAGILGDPFQRTYAPHKLSDKAAKAAYERLSSGAGRPGDDELAAEHVARLREQSDEAFGASPGPMGLNSAQSARNGIAYAREANQAEYEADRMQPTIAENAIAADMETLRGNVDPFANRSPWEQAEYEKNIGIVDPDSLQRYGYDQDGNPERQRTVDPNELMSGVDLGPSAYENVFYDADSLQGQREAAGYFDDVLGGTYDAEAEAMWRGRMGDAEQLARSQREADLQSLETRGFGGGGGAELLSNLDASQGIATTGAQASLDAAAMQQARKDGAAQSKFDAYSQIGRNLGEFDTNKASGLDVHAGRQGTLDYGTDAFNAGVYGGVNDDNWMRYWGNNDANADLENKTTAYNAGAYAANTDRALGAVGQEGDYALGRGNLSLGRDSLEFDKDRAEEADNDPWKWIDRVGNAVGEVGKLGWQPFKKEGKK